MPATRYINLFHRTFWPVLALLVCLVIWLMAVSRADAELDRADVQVTREAAAFADAYEQYLTRSVGQMDQLTMQLKFGWEHRSSPDLLQDLRRDGMFTERHFLAVSIIDRHGVVRSALNRAVQAPALADSALFTGHRDSISSALHISAAAPALGLAPNTVLFTRRLDTADDDFDGIVVLAVDARYFTTFADAGTLGSHGIVAVAGAGDSAFRLEQRGDGTLASGAAATQLPLDGANASQGTVQIIDALEVFGDGIARTVGWRRSSAYPLMAAVALSRADAEAPARQYWRNARDNALGATICLAVLASLSAMLAARAAARMREQEEVRSAYRTATESAKDGFYMATPIRDRQGDIVDFRIVDCNERGANFYGLERAALVGRRLSQLDRAHFGDELAASYRLAMEAGFHEEDRRIPGEPHADLRWGHRRLVRVGNGLAITLQDVSERKAHEAQLERLANEDSLTGLPNRHWFMQHIGKAIEQARAARTEFGLLFIDLDEFKYVNDSQGHSVGDLLLKAAADRLSALLRPTDHVVRYGGDEFIVFLSPTEGDLQIAAVAARIVSAFSRPFALAGDIQLVGASVGISVYPRDGTDAESLIKHSDIAMYAGKSEGKGQLRFFNPALSAGLQTQAQLKHGLSEAIACDQFILHYQPRVDTRSGELLSMEALLRWRHPQLGMVPPLDFIPLAEASGQIIQIGALVIDKACAQIAAWQRQQARVVPVSINVSPRQFQKGGIRHQLAASLQRHGVAPALLEVEITESAMMGDQDDIIAELESIRALGIKLHVDDFGTGYSSLSQLQRLRMDVLKVDRGFTAELGKSREGRVFFQAIVSMAHALGMTVVAEGVETEQQLAMLQSLGCNEVQGYLIARPLAASDMFALLGKRYLFSHMGARREQRLAELELR